jgi:MFS transporter, FSR family, fosmidomycin resistance protein
MRRLHLPILAGLAHFIADGSAGFLLGTLPNIGLSLEEIGALILFYNLLGFGCQPLIGLLADRLNRPRFIAVAGLTLIAIALCLGMQRPALVITLAGLGSAAFHVGGGALAIGHAEGKAGVLGLFAAPGVIGLAIGGLLAAANIPTLTWIGTLIFPILLIGCGLLIQFWGTTAHPIAAAGAADAHQQLDTHDIIMIVLLAAIALRSAVWVSIEYVAAQQASALVSLAIAAAFGKLAGGFFADRLGWRRYALIALGIAAPLLMLSENRPWLLLAGVALLQSTTPLGLALAARQLPRLPATAAGLTLGLAIAAGGLPHALGLSPILAATPMLAVITLASALTFWWIMPAILARSPHIHPAPLPKSRKLLRL